MKKQILTSLFLGMFALSVVAQPQVRPNGEGKTAMQRKYNIILQNETEQNNIEQVNARLAKADAESRAAVSRGLLGDALKLAYKSSFMTKTINASSNLLSYSLSALMQSAKSQREQWYKTAMMQCSMTRKLASETKVDDFYALPSSNGALDPQNMRFKGVGLQHYLVNPKKQDEGVGVFKMYCNVKTDDEGIASIVNHGKFLMDINEFWFKPSYCGLPNDSNSTSMTKFDFAKRSNLQLNVKVRIYSSWMNEAIMLVNDQLLGEFNIVAKIDKDLLDTDSVFVYDKNNPRHQQLVSIDGDCLMVPRSFTGTTDAKNYSPTWGTGEFRVEMELSETCQINNDYYMVREAGNAQRQAETALPGKTRWDKSKWKTEWTAMQTAKRGNFFKGAWESVMKAYRGSGWVQTFTDPLATAIASYETQKLTEWLKLPNAAQAAAAAQKSAAAAAAGGSPQGGAASQSGLPNGGQVK